jgi:tRNA threonylcarbamoyladenosine biosynthesis protein TsaB
VIVLAVETATDATAVALAREETVVASVVRPGRRHVEAVAPAVEEVCRRAALSLGDVELLAVDVGPGLFAGLRVGVGTVQALAFGLGRPVVGATSLEVLAHGVARAGFAVPVVVPVVDARRGEVFVARFTRGATGLVEEGEPALRRPEDLAAELRDRGEEVVVAGDGALRHADLLKVVPGGAVAGPAFAVPPVSELVAIAVARGRAGRLSVGGEVAPFYLRPPDVRINWERRTTSGAALGGSGR